MIQGSSSVNIEAKQAGKSDAYTTVDTVHMGAMSGSANIYAQQDNTYANGNKEQAMGWLLPAVLQLESSFTTPGDDPIKASLDIRLIDAKCPTVKSSGNVLKAFQDWLEITKMIDGAISRLPTPSTPAVPKLDDVLKAGDTTNRDIKVRSSDRATKGSTLSVENLRLTDNQTNASRSRNSVITAGAITITEDGSSGTYSHKTVLGGSGGAYLTLQNLLSGNIANSFSIYLMGEQVTVSGTPKVLKAFQDWLLPTTTVALQFDSGFRFEFTKSGNTVAVRSATFTSSNIGGTTSWTSAESLPADPQIALPGPIEFPLYGINPVTKALDLVLVRLSPVNDSGVKKIKCEYCTAVNVTVQPSTALYGSTAFVMA